MSGPFQNKTILQILTYYKDLWALSYVSGVAHWDLETYMPAKGVGTRGEALAKISAIRQKMFLDPAFAKLIATADKQKDLTDAEKGVVRVLIRSLKFYTKIPHDFLEEFEKLTNTATVVWRDTKEKNDYKLFEPSLTKIFGMNRKMAEYLGYTDSPYDALLDQFEEGLTVSDIEPFFDSIRIPLEGLLSEIKNSARYKEQLKGIPLASEKYDREEMEKLNHKVMNTFWSEPGRLRLDESSHPFTTSFGNNDTRITTRYHETGFSSSLLSVVHEFGHALYDLQCDNSLEQTPIQGGGSLVIHESQSRFWENFIGGGMDFIVHFLPDFEKVVGHKLDPEDVYFYFSRVKPGPIRVDADELTYHFHIMLRFEIEKGLMEGRIKNEEMRDYWNSKMKEYLGITPEKDSEGVLQDIHWSGGMVGYFPTYSMGTFLGAQWEDRIRKDLNISSMRIESLEKIKDWLKENIHKFGSTYTLAELLTKDGMKFNPAVNVVHLREKYSKIYGL